LSGSETRAGVGWLFLSRAHPTPTLVSLASTLPLQGRVNRVRRASVALPSRSNFQTAKLDHARGRNSAGAPVRFVDGAPVQKRGARLHSPQGSRAPFGAGRVRADPTARDQPCDRPASPNGAPLRRLPARGRFDLGAPLPFDPGLAFRLREGTRNEPEASVLRRGT
jgi:hypothetical protein